MENRMARFVGLAIIAATYLTVGEAVADPKMYWTTSFHAKIQRANLDGGEPEDLVLPGLVDSDRIALDVVGGKMHWIDSSKIQRGLYVRYFLSMRQ